MYKLNAQEVASTFQESVDGIATDLIRSHALKFSQEIESLSSPLFRWLEFRLRYVDPSPRRTVFSDNFPVSQLPVKAQEGLSQLIRVMEEGRDINPYQGRGLLKHDVSRELRGNRTDLLWADWGITHFHLDATPIPSDRYFSFPADYLAFCIVDAESVVFVDVLRHPNGDGFSDFSLLETVHRNWPAYMERFKLKGVLPGSRLSQSEIHSLREGGLSPFIVLGDSMYASPGMGITSASTPTKVTLIMNRLRETVDELSRFVSEGDGQVAKTLQGIDAGAPILSLCATERGLVVYDETSKVAFSLSKLPGMEEVCDLMVPSWAIEKLLANVSLNS
ncbi:hypothetical protein [Variovorax sp. CCNWLW235]|uniref:hypothetical protein n=1 Tax=Variovorax sp. CCNWLW235 TaxID=3127463 RepID=UPI0030773FDD